MPLGLTGPALLHVFIPIFLFAFMSRAWNIIGGFALRLSLGHAAFFGIGSYVSTICDVHLGLTPSLGMIVAAGITSVLGAALGLVSFRNGVLLVVVVPGIPGGVLRWLKGRRSRAPAPAGGGMTRTFQIVKPLPR
jgi:ABC-type branched-subunit amino acid transport system permease subunit